MKKIISYFVQALFVNFFFILGRILGLKLSRKIFSFLFSFLGPFFKSRKVIDKNLDTFSKNISVIEKEKIISNMWKNYGKTFIEYIYLNYFQKGNSHISVVGEENILDISRKNETVIFVSGHFANFELMSMEIVKKKIQLATIYRPLNNFFLNPLMEYLRKKYVCENQIKKGINGVRQAIEFIKKEHSIALMIDQRVSEGERINFFNKPALTTTLPAQLSIKFGITIVPVYIERTDDDNFNIEFLKSLNPKNFTDKIELSLELNKILERMIIKNPSQWIWTHDRWK
tara:strand:- start:5541 stop:6398 length:858 start_codon:yes stop_codon:yes gene_type:complete